MARTKLRGVKLNEVSFVGKGDNKGANILLVKSADIVKLGKDYKGKDKSALLQKWFEEDTSKVDGVFKEEEASMFADLLADKTVRDQVWSMVWMLEDSICSIMNDESGNNKGEMITTTVEQFREAITSLTKSKKQGGKGNMPKTMTEMEQDLAVVSKERDDLKTQVDTLTKEKETLVVKVADLEKAAKPQETSIDKSKLSPEVRKQMEDQESELKKQREDIEKMKDDALTKECGDIAKEMPSIGTEGVEVPTVLKSIKKYDATLYSQVCSLFKTAHERIKAGGLFVEKGRGGDDPNAGASAYDKLVAKAKELQKADSTLSFAKAFDTIYKNEHDLRKQYNEERS